ncbi:uncharacterized protein LOC131015057 [Salvia miltiorrhiza]|uniref:uncharacterized protein LOC131015057 n=1 Tax=Salvia miltiorrhiza TaxID=226208 RepID=UPI0025ACED94|nr:uncharacterized protein LOC131015057 [Salvia miltiorrhiza]
MAPLYTNIDALVTHKTNQALKVRFVRVYSRYAPGSKTKISRIECVVHDEQGTRVQLTVPQKLKKQFGNKFKEGSVYQVMNFMVKNNGPKFKTFEEILQLKNTDQVGMFDVIGVINGKGFVKNDSESKMVELKLEDQNQNQIYCTLWEGFVDAFLSQADPHDHRAHIIIVQLCRPNFYRATSYNASRIFLNADLPEIHEFRKQIAGNESYPEKLELTFDKGYVEKDDFLNGNITVKTLDDIFCTQFLPMSFGRGEHWICAKVDSVDCYSQWCYDACRKCTRKTVKLSGRFYCSHCDKYDSVVNKRYHLLLNVVDSTNNACLLVWDKDAVALIEKKASEISMDDEEAADPKIVPKEIDRALIDIIIMFKISMKSESSFLDDKPYTVLKTYTDQVVSTHFWEETDGGVAVPLNDPSEEAYLEHCESLSQITDLTDYGDGLSMPITAALTGGSVSSKNNDMSTEVSYVEDEASLTKNRTDEVLKDNTFIEADVCVMPSLVDVLSMIGGVEDCVSLSQDNDFNMGGSCIKASGDVLNTPVNVPVGEYNVGVVEDFVTFPQDIDLNMGGSFTMVLYSLCAIEQNKKDLEVKRPAKACMKLSFVSPVLKNGIPTACLNAADIEIEAEKWKHAIILYVVGDSPTIS